MSVIKRDGELTNIAQNNKSQEIVESHVRPHCMLTRNIKKKLNETFQNRVFYLVTKHFALVEKHTLTFWFSM